MTTTQFPQETTGPELTGDLDYYVNEIGERWCKNVDGIFAVAKLCNAAVKDLTNGQLDSLKKRLRLNKSTLCKLYKIANDPRLVSETVYACLPPNYTIIDEIRKLTDRQLADAVADRTIHPHMRRADLEIRFGKRKATSKHTSLATLVQITNICETRRAIFHSQMKKLFSCYPEFRLEGKSETWTMQAEQ